MQPFNVRLLPVWFLLGAATLGVPAWGETVAVGAPTPVADPLGRSALNAELFYELFLGEVNVVSGQPDTGAALVLDAARKSKDASLYQRAVEIALKAHSGVGALQAAQAWRRDMPTNRSANRTTLQILIALNRVNDSGELLKAELALAPTADRAQVIAEIPRLYQQLPDKKLVATVVEQVLTDAMASLAPAQIASAAWTTVGRLRIAAENLPGALAAAQRAQSLTPGATGATLLALELLERKHPGAESIVRTSMGGTPDIELRMAYVRALADLRRYGEALIQLQLATGSHPDYPPAWLIQGTLLLQESQAKAAETSLLRYLQLAQAGSGGAAPDSKEENRRGLMQAHVALAQIAEDRKDLDAAQAWLDKIPDAKESAMTQSRRASILARQGKLEQARQLLRALPETDESESRTKLFAEVQLLRDNKQYPAAYDLLAQAQDQFQDDADLLYDQAMVCEKMGRLDELERLLRRVMVLKPDYHHAYNALGFSLADRNVRLPEAKQLIQKALAAAPDDPFIQDSLGWVEFRLGNRAEALRLLEAAHRTRPDVEIAAHLGEVFWSLGQPTRALAVWRGGHKLNAGNDTLQETLKRLRVKL
ncbi:MAG: hypothetical protein RLZZ401_1858 [Pseudomonadota bacterium]